MPALPQAVVEVPAGRGHVDLLERDEERGAALHLEDGAVALLGHAHRLQLTLPERQVSFINLCFSSCLMIIIPDGFLDLRGDDEAAEHGGHEVDVVLLLVLWCSQSLLESRQDLLQLLKGLGVALRCIVFR